MSFFNNPDLLTKERLREDLRNNGVKIPTGNPAKSVLVDLYITHLTSKNKDGFEERSEFSDDEPLTPNKSPRKRVIKKMSKKMISLAPEEVDVDSLTDQELMDELKKLGETPGPITDTTRKFYKRKLTRLLSSPSAQRKEEAKKDEDEEFSDTEEIEEVEEEEVEEEVEEMEVDGPEEVDDEPALSQEKTVTVVEEADPKHGKTIKTTTTTTTTTLKKRAVSTATSNAVTEPAEPAESHPISNGHTVPKAPSKSKAKSSKTFYFLIFLLILAVIIGVLLYHHMEENPLKHLPDFKPSTRSDKAKAS